MYESFILLVFFFGAQFSVFAQDDGVEEEKNPDMPLEQRLDLLPDMVIGILWVNSVFKPLFTL